MLSNPKPGQAVLIWYGKQTRDVMLLHGRIGTVVHPGKGSQRNHLVEVDGAVHVVPCGNLEKADR